MMTSNTLPAATIIQSQIVSPKIPFESSKTMDECRIQVLRKFRKEIIETVRFSDVSEVLIACDLVSKEECYEICKLSVTKQMLQCYQKVHDIMDILVCQKSMMMSPSSNAGNGTISTFKNKQSAMMEEKQNGLVKELWNNFISSLRKEHPNLATKMENELDRITENKLLLKRNTNGSKLRKEDIGLPTDFKHIQHYGLITRSKSEPVVPVRLKKEKNQQKKLDRKGSIDEEKEKLKLKVSPSMPKLDELNESDPDLQEFFKRAGVEQAHLMNPTTREIILRFIMENGGISAIRNEIRAQVVVLPNENKIPKTKTSVVEQLKVEDKQEGSKQEVISPPTTVPFEPTPRPTPSTLFYF